MLTAPAKKPLTAPAAKQARFDEELPCETLWLRRLNSTIAKIDSPVPRTSKSSGACLNASRPSGRKTAAPIIANRSDAQSIPSR